MTGKPTDNAPWEDPCASIHGIIAAAQEPRRFGAAHEMIVPVSLLSAVVAEMIQTRLQRDEARRVLKSIVEEFVQHAQAMNPFYPATPSHECEFSWNPESGKCDACEAWGDYVLICHPLEKTGEETP